MWSDKETDEDLLGYTVHAGLLKQVVISKQNLPVTIGLYGSWGSGKSSILKILEKQIQEEEDSKGNSIVIYFDGWSFESFDDAKMALIQGIVDKLEGNKSFKGNVKRKVKQAAKTVKDKLLSMRTLLWATKNVAVPVGLAWLTGGASIVPNLISFFRSFNSDEKRKELVDNLTGNDAESFLSEAFRTHIDAHQFSALREFREEFKKLIDATGRDRVVILIDDLDRCLPEHIIENLEAIKLFLNVDKTAFVIAADEEIVSGAIKRQYGNMINLTERKANGRDIGSDYMDKFIQIPYKIPKLSDIEVETYITLLFCKSILGEDIFQLIFKDYHKFIDEHKFEAYGWTNIKEMDGVKGNTKLEHIVSFMVHCSTLISNSLYRNPRLIKRFLNAFEIRSQLLRQSGNYTEENQFILLKLMLLEMSHPTLFTQLSEWTMKDKNGRSNNLVELEEEAKSGNIKNEKYKEWDRGDVKSLLSMDPLFSSTDLRDIYWVSRDMLVDGMGGVSLIPTRIKNLFQRMFESGSDTTIKEISNTEVKQLNTHDLRDIYELLDNKILVDTTSRVPYVIYYYLIEAGVEDAYNSFIDIFTRVGSKAPLSISNYIKKLLEHNNNDPELVSLIGQNKKLSGFVFGKKLKRSSCCL